MNQILFNLTAGTHVGCVRTNNEDNFVLNADLSQKDWFLPQDASKPLVLGGNGCVLVVADGMGGANCGEVASAIVVREVQNIFNEADLESIRQSDISIERFLESTIVEADLAVKQHAKENPESRGMGTTIVLAWIIDGNVHLSWCGDSRAYIYNKVNGLQQISKDHSFVQSLVDKGELAPEDVFGHPQSNIITRCLGDFPTVAQPDYRLYTFQQGDTLMLCSDGLSAYCPDPQIAEVMGQHEDDVVNMRNALLQTALDAGGYDNVTVAVMSVDLGEAEPEPAVQEHVQDIELENEQELELEPEQENELELDKEQEEVSEDTPKESKGFFAKLFGGKRKSKSNKK